MTESYVFTENMTGVEATLLAEWCGGFLAVEVGNHCRISVPTPEGLMAAFPGDRIVCEAGDFRVERRSA